MYNMLFGKNPDADLLLEILGLDQEDNEYPTGRFRDIYVTEEYIVLYTRNGGGNRSECWGEGDEERCTCCACCINEILPKHPLYCYDRDDDFDYTYNNCYFKKPDLVKYFEVVKDEPRDKWNELFKKLNKENK